MDAAGLEAHGSHGRDEGRPASGGEAPRGDATPTPAALERRLAAARRVLLAVAVLAPIAALLPELVWLTPDLNDGAFHAGLARNAADAIREGANPLDFWVPTWLCGYPLFHYYQPAPHLLVAALHLLSGGALPILLLLRVTTIAALALAPLANDSALRRLGFGDVEAGAGALLITLVSGAGTYGIEWGSFTWAGWGLYAQAIALPLLPLAIAAGYRALVGRRRTLSAAALLAAALLSHVLYGYIAALSLALAPIAARSGRRLLALSRFGLQSFALVAFFVVPLALDGACHVESYYDGAAKFDSHGAAVVLTRLVAGTLLDDGRLPALTALAAIGLYLCLRRLREEGEAERAAHGFLVLGFVFWTLAYFGRATWGPLADLLPMSRGLHFERLSSGVQLFAVWLAAVALGNLLRRALALEGPRLRAAAVMGLVAVFLGPMLAERTRAAVRNGELVASGKMRFDADVREFAPILERLRTEPPGRVYAGRRGDWGESYRLGDVPVYQLLSALAIPDVGNAPFSWAPTTDFQMDGGEPSLGLFDARYVVADRPELAPPRGELLFVSGRHRLWRVAAEGPFSIVAAPFTIAGGHDRAWYLERLWLAGRWPGARALPRLDLDGGAAAGPVLRALDPLHDVLPGEAEARYVFDLPGPFEAEPPAPARGTIAGAEVARGEARARVTLETPGTVLFKTTWHPCWTATVDGAPAPVAALVPGLMGVDVPAGEHELRLAYRPGWLKAALAAAGLVLAVLLDLGRGARRA